MKLVEMGVKDSLMINLGQVSIFVNRKVTIVPNLAVSDKARERMETTAKELIEERNAAIEVCGD